MSLGCALLLAGVAMYVGSGRTSLWLFVLGIAGIVTGLARIATG